MTPLQPTPAETKLILDENSPADASLLIVLFKISAKRRSADWFYRGVLCSENEQFGFWCCFDPVTRFHRAGNQVMGYGKRGISISVTIT